MRHSGYTNPTSILIVVYIYGLFSYCILCKGSTTYKCVHVRKICEKNEKKQVKKTMKNFIELSFCDYSIKSASFVFMFLSRYAKI